MYYTSNERDYFTLSTGIHNSEDRHESRKMYTEIYFFYLNFSVVHISTNNVPGSLKFCIQVGNMHVEGTVSQIFFSYPSFNFMTKNG